MVFSATDVLESSVYYQCIELLWNETEGNFWKEKLGIKHVTLKNEKALLRKHENFLLNTQNFSEKQLREI